MFIVKESENGLHIHRKYISTQNESSVEYTLSSKPRLSVFNVVYVKQERYLMN